MDPSVSFDLTMWSSLWNNGCRGSCPPASPPSAGGCCLSGPSRRCSWWCSPSWPHSPPPAYLPQRAQLELQTQVERSVTRRSKYHGGRLSTTLPSHPQERNGLDDERAITEINTLSCLRTLWLTCGAVVLHFADKYAKSMFGAPADAEAQAAIRTFVNSHRVDVFTVVTSCETKRNHIEMSDTWSVLYFMASMLDWEMKCLTLFHPYTSILFENKM